MGQLRHAMRAYAVEGHSPGGRARPARQAGARPRRRPDGDAALPRHGARRRHGPVRERGPRAAARDHPRRRRPLPGERAQPAARRVRQPGPHRDDDGADARARRSCSTRTGSWRSAACRSTRGSRRCGWRPPRTRATPRSCASGSWSRCSAVHPAERRHRRARRCARCRRRRRRSTSSCRPTRPAGRHAPRPRNWLRDAGASGEVVEVIQIACHEACSNAIEHGYEFGDGRLWVDAELDDGRVILTVRDKGHWIERARRPAALPRQRPAADAGADGHGGADARQRRTGRRCGWRGRCLPIAL